MEKEIRQSANANAESTEQFDRNVDEEILDVISHSDFGRQQQILRKMAESTPEISIARRLYSTLFPVMDSNNSKG
jgi:hypothetical protein